MVFFSVSRSLWSVDNRYRREVSPKYNARMGHQAPHCHSQSRNSCTSFAEKPACCFRCSYPSFSWFFPFQVLLESFSLTGGIHKVGLFSFFCFIPLTSCLDFVNVVWAFSCLHAPCTILLAVFLPSVHRRKLRHYFAVVFRNVCLFATTC